MYRLLLLSAPVRDHKLGGNGCIAVIRLSMIAFAVVVLLQGQEIKTTLRIYPSSFESRLEVSILVTSCYAKFTSDYFLLPVYLPSWTPTTTG